MLSRPWPLGLHIQSLDQGYGLCSSSADVVQMFRIGSQGHRFRVRVGCANPRSWTEKDEIQCSQSPAGSNTGEWWRMGSLGIDTQALILGWVGMPQNV